jgi:glutamate/tyrosine decarboxylase-like PLP-dependent enzyme
MTQPSPFPAQGLPHQEVLTRLREFSSGDADYRSGRTWSLVYWLGDQHTRFLQDAYNCYFSENGLNPLAFSSLKRLETEVVRMTAGLLHGGAEACGTMTSGGTESCLLAVKTYRDRARRKRPWVLWPEVIVPTTVHVAFEKAAHYFGVKLVHAPLGKDLRVDVAAVKRRITRNTVAIVGSAPCYPFGVVDPIAELGELAQRKGLPLHVDACLGGFLLPFVERLGLPVPAWDFRVPGVCSISADVHKYGYAAKGASVLLYRQVDLLQDQFFVHTDWPGGVFASPALLGTRPGGAVAAAWAALMALGERGYLDLARSVMDTTRRLVAGVGSIPGLQVLGRPDLSVFAYRSTERDLSIYAVGDRMQARGWHVDRQQGPESLHAMVTPRHAEVADAYLADLRDSVEEVRREPGLALQGGAAMYGMIAHVPLRGLVRDAVMKMMREMYGPQGLIADPQAAGQADGLAERAGRWFLAKRGQALQALDRLRGRA